MTTISRSLKFVQCFRPKFASDYLVLVQYLKENELVIFDRKGRGEVWETEEKEGDEETDERIQKKEKKEKMETSENKFVPKNLKLSTGYERCLHRAYYHCVNQNETIVACTDIYAQKLYVFDPSKGYDFRALGSEVDVDGKFELLKVGEQVYLIKNDEKEVFTIHTTLSERIGPEVFLKKWFEEKEETEEDRNNQITFFGKDVPFDEGVCSSSDLHESGATSRLSEDIFDLSSIPPEHNNLVVGQFYIPQDMPFPEGKVMAGKSSGYNYYDGIKRISCYCTKGRLLICGHDGFVSVWESQILFCV